MLILRGLQEEIGGCKWFGINTYRRGLQVLIVKGLGGESPASVGYKGASGERGVRSEGGGRGWAEIHGE